jgi:hypothetical protein
VCWESGGVASPSAGCTLPGKGDLGKVAIGQRRSSVTGSMVERESRMRASSASTSASVSFRRRLLHLHVLVAVNREVGKHFEGCFEAQRLAVFELDFGHLRLRDGLQLLLGDRGAEVLREHCFHHILANLFGEAAADKRLRNLARTEARDARHLFVSFGNCLKIAGHFVRGNFNFNFSGAFRVQGRRACEWPSWSCPPGSSVAVDTSSDCGVVSIISVELNVCLPDSLALCAAAMAETMQALRSL